MQRLGLQPFIRDRYYSMPDSKGYSIESCSHNLILEFLKNRYRCPISKTDLDLYIRLKGIKILDIIEIQYYINALKSRFPWSEQIELIFIRKAKIDFIKQGSFLTNPKRAGLDNLVNAFCQQLRNAKKENLFDSMKLFFHQLINNKETKELPDAKKIAKMALDAAQREFPLGSTNIKPIMHDSHSDKITIYPGLLAKHKSPHRKKIDALIDDNLMELAKKRIRILRAELRQKKTITDKMTDVFQTKLIRGFISHKASYRGTANCGEQTTFLFLYLLKHYPGRIELVEFEEYEKDEKDTHYLPYKMVDHAFIVINRPINSDHTNWKTWGPEAVVIDPWINQSFTADKLGEIWQQNPWRFNPMKRKTTIILNDTVFRQSVPFESLRFK